MSRFADAYKRLQQPDYPGGSEAAAAAVEPFGGGDRVVPPWQFPEDARPAPPAARPEPAAQPEPAARPEQAARPDPAGRPAAARTIEAPRRRARFDRSTDAAKLVVSSIMPPVAREQYRKLGAACLEAQLAHGIKVIMITSAGPFEGKTLTAANLALTFSESYRTRVALIDGDLRKPSVHSVLALKDGCLTAEQLKQSAPWPLVQVTQRLAAFAPSEPLSDPMTALASEQMRELVKSVREQFDWVLIDTPPVGLLPDASVLANLVDAIVVVVSSGETAYQNVQRACDTVGVRRVLGVVLNRAAERSASDRYGYSGAGASG